SKEDISECRQTAKKSKQAVKFPTKEEDENDKDEGDCTDTNNEQDTVDEDNSSHTPQLLEPPTAFCVHPSLHEDVVFYASLAPSVMPTSKSVIVTPLPTGDEGQQTEDWLNQIDMPITPALEVPPINLLWPPKQILLEPEEGLTMGPMEQALLNISNVVWNLDASVWQLQDKYPLRDQEIGNKKDEKQNDDPPVGFVKLNFDGVSKDNTGTTGAGWFLRDQKQHFPIGLHEVVTD
ncbi:hypothetical protein KI387_022423, partial [Taxus chinensis]